MQDEMKNYIAVMQNIKNNRDIIGMKYYKTAYKELVVSNPSFLKFSSNLPKGYKIVLSSDVSEDDYNELFTLHRELINEGYYSE